MSSGSGGRRSEGVPMATRSTEGFFRSQASNKTSGATRQSDSGSSLPLPVQPQTMDRVAESSGSAPSAPVSSVPVISRSGSTRPGALRPPNELGRQEAKQDTAAEIQNKPKTPVIHPRSVAVRKRTIAAIRGSMTQAAAALSAEALKAAKEKTSADDPSMLCSITYRGMEVIFASTHSPQCRIYAICARTRLVFQTLDLPSPDHNYNDNNLNKQTPLIVSVMGNQTSGLIAVAMSDGTIQTYAPTPTDPAIHAFGRYRWVDGCTIRCSSIFYQPGEKMTFLSKRHAKPGDSLEMSSSRDQKLLVAHRNQLAVFDVGLGMPSSSSSAPSSTANRAHPLAELDAGLPSVAQLLWASSTKHPIVTASISGDGQAIAVVSEDSRPGVYDATCGVRIFLRDRDDGSLLDGSSHQPLPLQRTTSVGILYKQGPFLDHSEPVTRISFRGIGHNTASALGTDEQSDDLLLSFSKHDNIARVFHQHSWSKLVEWNTPPNTRVDWVRGAAAFSLGDLETQKRLNPKSESRPPSRSPSSQDLAGEQNGFGQGLLPQGGRQLLHNTTPSSAAGAWITETTFSGAFPAVRLSRLSYLHRGSETMHPALFESVASILPAGSMSADIVLNSGDEGLSIHGIWPAWNPWLSETSDGHSDETLSGSAMAFLGLSSGPSTGQSGSFGEGILGGSHSPPNELRIVAAHALCGNIVVMEFPLWGNREMGELELGSVIRHMLSLPDIEQLETDNDEHDTNKSQQVLSASTNFESNRLVAKLRPDAVSIELTWRKQGTMSICPASWESKDYEQSLEETAYSEALTEELGIAECYRDRSLIPSPLSLPPIFLPRGVVSTTGGEHVETIKWWPDENFGGPPLLVVITSMGTLLVFEVPPPWCALEPPMPNDDPFLDFGGSVKGDSVGSLRDLSIGGTGTATDNDSEEGGWAGPKEYDVMITPDPDFGLGLRLESQLDGLPAIAGSYKKHPLTGGRLPVEKVGMIVLGDELLSVDGVRLTGVSFDDIIATVRQVGSEAGPGKPLCMRFRRVGGRRRKLSSEIPAPMPVEVQVSDGSRRSMEQMLGVSTGKQSRVESSAASSVRTYSRAGSGASLDYNNDDEVQQEFCRLVAVARKVFPSARSPSSKVDLLNDSSFVLLPWTSGIGAPAPLGLRGAALVFHADGDRIFARRLEVSSDNNPDKANICDLGYFDLEQTDNGGKDQRIVKSMSAIETGTESKCLAVCDNFGSLQLIFASLEGDGDQAKGGVRSSALAVAFRHYNIFKFDDTSYDRCLVRASSIDLLATMRQKSGGFPVVTVWSARPHPAGTQHDNGADLHEYIASDISVGSHSKDVVELCFVRSGFLDAFPLFAMFCRTEVVIYQKLAGWLSWKPIRAVSYASIPGSHTEILTMNSNASCNPLDSFPHLLPAIRSIIQNSDEQVHLRADWHPDALLARLFTDTHGPKTILLHQVAGYFLWLAKRLPKDLGGENENSRDLSEVTTLASVNLVEPIDDGQDYVSATNSGQDEAMLRKLQSVLASGFSQGDFKKGPDSKMAEQVLPTDLQALKADDLRILWAIGEVVLAKVDFKSLDTNGEFFVFSAELLKKIKALPKDASNSKASDAIHSFSFNRKATKTIETTETEHQLPSAATLFALMSNAQGNLVESCRIPGVGIDWNFMKEYNIPFWMRSDSSLAKLSEEVGQTIFRAKRDILESALFFIVARKLRTLRNLAATDQTESGSKFFKFLTNFDFKSERGRRAAEKNAYSLLRKRRYGVAASFFLLAEPPFLKLSLEVIATQLQDLNMAFLVARLMESPEIAASAQSTGVGGGGGGLGMGSLMGMGGGGGFASSFASAPPTAPPRDETKFMDWKPTLKSAARNLLLDRGLAQSVDDNCLTSVQLMWLGQPHEASFWLSGLAQNKHNTKSLLPDVGDLLLPITPDRYNENKKLLSSPKSLPQPSIRACSRINSLVNFLSGPLLLRSLDAKARPRFAASLIVARALMRFGIELPSVRALLLECDTKDKEETDPGMTQRAASTSTAVNGQEASSIFDDYDTAPAPKKAAPATTGMSSSIFDSFDAPRPPAKQPIQDTMQSSIFDDFSAPPPPKKATPPPVSADMNSSIFDSFDAPRPPPEKPSQDPMQSSIFDDFNAAPTKKTPPPPTSADMNSSIFDSFDAPRPPPPKKPSQDPTQSSSIFDDFSAAPQLPKKAQQSSIFDAYDLPAQSAKPTAKQEEPADPAKAPPKEQEERKIEGLGPTETPRLWEEWRDQVLLFASAKRLVRELSCFMIELHGDAFDPQALAFSKDKNSLLPSGAAEVLQLPCEGELILDRIGKIADKISSSRGLQKNTVVEMALRALAVPQHLNRMFYAVLLQLSNQRGDLAEDLLRDAAHLILHRCNALAIANDPPMELGKTCSHMSSLYFRQQMARLSWQMELCLWLHRGGALPLSGVAINEAIVAVRVGYTLASWNRNYECLETMLKSDPDCQVDNEAGRQHWTSLKIITHMNPKKRATGKASSGGWEFLVDCKRSEATDLLRHKHTGCFIIRPHVEDHGVFTLSFKTNLVPTAPKSAPVDLTQQAPSDEQDDDAPKPPKPKPRPVKKDDVVQHAIVRLSDSGFRCGSFGPFTSLMKLLEAVSASLPFDLRFDQPPAERVIKDEGSQPSPNAVFLRKLVLRNADSMATNPPSGGSFLQRALLGKEEREAPTSSEKPEEEKVDLRESVFGDFLELLILSSLRKPLSGIAASKYEDNESDMRSQARSAKSTDDAESTSNDTGLHGLFDEQYALSARMLRPFLSWCRVLELHCECELAPGLKDILHSVSSPAQITLAASETAIEAIEEEVYSYHGDSVIRRMIQPNSGVDFRTLRLADGGDSTVVVLFSKDEATEWLIQHGTEKTKEDALEKLEAMEKIRVIEPIDLSKLQLKAYSAQKGSKPEEDTGVRYRIVDPWEVEALDSREGETKSAAIGRERFLAFSLGKVAIACEAIFRQIGGLPALELWTSAKGGVALTKAIASAHPPWERGEGGDMRFDEGAPSEPSPFANSIRQHLYRNSLFRSIRLPQRFLALVQVELLDLKNLTAPGGSLSLTVYALLRLRRSDSGAPLTSKTRTLDSAATPPMKLAKSTGPNAPASWGSVVRFRFPLPEDVSCDGVSLDRNREILFKGPPCVLQLSVYERKLLIDNPLGDADVKIDGLAAGGQLEEWVPLRTGKHGINWFARIRLTLRFELMCLSNDDAEDLTPSVGLKRIQHLSRMGGAQEDIKKSVSTPDLLGYFESMVY